jgi:cysteine synthase A
MIKKGTLALINHTPLMLLDKLEPGKRLYAKLEFVQPGGSIKDRVAYQMIKDAYANGSLKKGQVVVEMTSGNMGAGLAVVCKQFGNPFVAVMSEGNSPERRRMLKALDAELLLTKQVDGSPGMVTGNDIAYAGEVAKAYAAKKDAFYVDQFNNPSNVLAHYNTTGPEIWNDLPDIEAFIASVGSGGTFVGTSTFLKSQNQSIQCIASEPENAAILKTGIVKSPKHIIQGTGYSAVPPHWKADLADDIITVSDEQVAEITKSLSHEQGLFVGYSSGANVAAALNYLKYNPTVKRVVTVLCDTGFKYSDNGVV